jgi:Fe-S oxidoreductase
MTISVINEVSGQAQSFVERPGPASVSEIALRCTRCGLCQKDCSFLQRYGLPGDIAACYSADRASGWSAAFACSLCGLCAETCPLGLTPDRMFLDLRRDAFMTGNGDLSEHSRVLNYEKRGTSKSYTWYALPEGCDTIFFPGCTLPGTRPKTTLRLYEYLQARDPGIGIVLDCCTKPSHDLGRQKYFMSMFSELNQYLISAGVKKVLVACPNCHRVFSRYGFGLQVVTVYEHLTDLGFIPNKTANTTVTVHDPCGIRGEAGIHDAVRALIGSHGLIIREMKHIKERTLCCGEGGAVGCVDHNLSRQWGQRRIKEAEGNRILTYCAGCAGMLGKITPTDHLIDLLFDPERTFAGKAKVSKAPITYLNRLRLKKYLQRQNRRAKTRERTFSATPAGRRKKPWFQILLFVTVLAAIAGIRSAGLFK